MPTHPTRLSTTLLAVTLPLVAVVLIAHPGHEYKVTGTISKVRAQQQFEVTEGDGARTTFFIVPATEVRVGSARGVIADIKVGAKATAEGIENDKGMIEAKVVRLSAEMK